jgi:hypothetical protein
LIVGVGYLVALTIWTLSLHARGKALLRQVGERIEPALWQSLGAPESINAAMRDPQRRWHRFLRSGEYRRQCSNAVIELIDDYRRRVKIMLAVFSVGGLLLLIRFWPLFKPDFL